MTVNETLSHSSSPVVASHVIAFQMRIVSVNGKPVAEEPSLYKALRVADEHMFSQLPLAVSGWKFLDHDHIEGDRLELYETEFAAESDHGDEAPTLYEIAMASTRELPLRRADATADLPLSIEQLMDEVPKALQSIYAHHGIELTLATVRFYKTQTVRQQGVYTFG